MTARTHRTHQDVSGWALRRLTPAAIAALLALLLAACGAGERGVGSDPTADPSGPASPTIVAAPSASALASPPATSSPVPEMPRFSRLRGVTTAIAFESASHAGKELWTRKVPRVREVRIRSSKDGVRQAAMWLPPKGKEQPLIVSLHSWSSTYEQHYGIPYGQWAAANGWALIHPDFRGVNDRPQATGSALAVQDVIDAVDFAVREGRIDEDRVFLTGFSGGGMLALLAAARHPDRFAGAAAWVPIHDLYAWYEFNRDMVPPRAYAAQIRASCGGDPSTSAKARRDCERRSPSTYLGAARRAGVPVYIGHGLSDGVVPPLHSVRAYDQLAQRGDRLGAEVRQAVARNRLPGDLRGSVKTRTFFRAGDPRVLFARRSGAATLVIFEGGHDMVYNPALEWMWTLAHS